jgi:hypothetical protein
VAAQIERDIKLTALERCVPPIYSLFSLRVRLLPQSRSLSLPFIIDRLPRSLSRPLLLPTHHPSPPSPSLSLQGASSSVAAGGPGAGGAGGGKGTTAGGTGTQQGTAATRRGTTPTESRTYGCTMQNTMQNTHRHLSALIPLRLTPLCRICPISLLTNQEALRATRSLHLERRLEREREIEAEQKAAAIEAEKRLRKAQGAAHIQLDTSPTSIPEGACTNHEVLMRVLPSSC